MKVTYLLALVFVAALVRDASSLTASVWNPPLMPVKVSSGEVVIMGELKLEGSSGADGASAPTVTDVIIAADAGVFFTIENEIAPRNLPGPGNKVVFTGEALQGNLRFYNGTDNSIKLIPTLGTEDWAVFFFVLHVDRHGTVAGSVPESLNFTVNLSDGQTVAITESVSDPADAVIAEPVRVGLLDDEVMD